MKSFHTKDPPASPEEIARIKRNIEAQIADLESASLAALAWWREWKKRRPRGFRATRRGKSPQTGL